MTYPHLHLMLQAASRRMLALGLARVFCLLIAAGVIGLLASVTVDAIWALPTPLLILCDAVMIGIASAGLVGLWRVIRAGSFEPRRIARSLERQLGLTDNSLINAVDLQAEPRTSVSRGLVNATIERADAAATRIELKQAIAARPLRIAAWGMIVALIVMSVVFLIEPRVFYRGLPRLLDPQGGHPPYTSLRFNVGVNPDPLYFGSPATIHTDVTGRAAPDRADIVFAADKRDVAQQRRVPMVSAADGFEVHLDQVEDGQFFFVDTPRGRSDWYRYDVIQSPRFSDGWVKYSFPEYTDWTPRQHPLDNRPIQAIEGTRIELEVSSNMPLSGVDVVINWQNGQQEKVRLTPDPADSSKATGAFELKNMGAATLTLQGANGLAGSERLALQLAAVDDRPPRVAITNLEPTVFAVEDWKLPLSVEAEDDIEVRNLELDVSHNRGPADREQLASQVVDRRRARASRELDLADLGAKAGDEVRVFASAADNAPRGSQSADSATHVVHVISKEEYEGFLRASYGMEEMTQELTELESRLQELEEQRQQAIEALTESMSSSPGEGLDEEQRREIESAQQVLDKLQQATSSLQEQVAERLDAPQLYESETAYREELQELQDELQKQSQAARAASDALQEVSSSEAPTAGQQERLSQATEQMKSQEQLLNETRQQQLDQMQQDATDLQLADTMLQEAAQIQEVMEEQRDLAERMQALRSAAAPAPLSPPNPSLRPPVTPGLPAAQPPGSPSDPPLTEMDQRRADRLAHEQELLEQQLQEAREALQAAAQQAQERFPKTAGDAKQLAQAIEEQQVTQDQQASSQACRAGQGQQAQQSADTAAKKLEALASQCPGGDGMSNERSPDSGLGLSANDWKKSLEQMQRGRKMVRGSRGQGTSGQMPSALSSSATPQLGRRGNGGRAQIGIHGPQPPTQAFSGRRRGADERSSALADGRDELPRAVPERLSSESNDRLRGNASQLRGVPAGYRDQAEAYFRRLTAEPNANP
ncbi:MAG: hypothetical protein KDA92_10775 [Planctomycetales bacterium]|nr:hypothetical protein [Planctomycetales bacterium]